MTVTEKDAYGNQENAAGEVTPVLAASAGSLSSATDNGNGTFTYTLTSSTTVAQANITGTISGVAIGTSAVVLYIPGPVGHYVVSAGNPQTAGTVFTVTVTGQDAFNNTATNDSSDSVTLSLTGSATVSGSNRQDVGEWSGHLYGD